MSQETSPVQAEIQEEQRRDWKDEYKESFLNTRLGIEALMVDRIQRQQRAEEAMARHTRQLAGVEEGGPEEASSSMGVSIGNKNFYHYDAPQQNGPASQTGASGTSLLQKAVMGLALIGGGSGLGYLLGQVINPPAVVHSIDTDTDTISVIDFPD